MKKKSSLIHKNRKAYFNYEIIETFDAGIVLTGAEVKSTKNGQINLRDAFVRFDDNEEAWLWNSEITKYKYSSDKDYDSKRSRKLLLHKKEIMRIMMKSKEARLTIVPTKAFLQRGRIKIQIGLAKGKKQHEKKEKVKERDLKRELHREKRQYMVK